jgi:hypothetical protein
MIMKVKWVLPVALVALFGVGARGQSYENYHSDAAVQGFGAFQKPDAVGLGVTDKATYAGGFLASYRYHFNHLSALEVNYGFTKFSQRYSTALGPERVQADVHEASLAYVLTPHSFYDGKLRPFVLAGTGALFFRPTNGGAFVQDRAAFLYGGGVDYFPLSDHKRFGLRLGYRGLVYRAPSFDVPGLNTEAVTNLAEPYAGIVFRF